MTEVEPSRLQNFPISWFAVVMGMAGFTGAWHHAEILLALPVRPSLILLALTVITFVLLLALYLTKILKYPNQVKAEYSNPITLNFFPTVSIDLILISVLLLPYSHSLSLASWVAGAFLHLTFTLHVLSMWLHQTHFEVEHVNPAWFIPVVGNILVPIAGVSHASPEVSWFFFSIGLVFWLVLLTIIFYRMLFHQPLSTKLLPTLFILIAPPAAGFISWLQLTGDLNAFARILYYVSVFLTLMLMTQVKRFLKLQFTLSSWAYSFPMAAITIATFTMYEELHLPFFKGLGMVLLTLLTVLIAMLIWKTARAVRCRAICLED